MKFAQQFRAILKNEDFPSAWVDNAIPYGLLKKVLKKVQAELLELGLDSETLRELLQSRTDAPLALQYTVDGGTTAQKALQPKLTVLVYMQDGIATDAKLSPTSQALMQRLAAHGNVLPRSTSDPEPTSSTAATDTVLRDPEDSPTRASSPPSTDTDVNRAASAAEVIEIPLVFNGEFFEILQNDVTKLDALHQHEETELQTQITHMSRDLARVTKPTRFATTDLAKWQRLFELYLQSQVFFSLNEHDSGDRNSQLALTQLQWFQKEATALRLPESFQLASSRDTFQKFLQMNARLWKNLRFQEVNRIAVSKILKNLRTIVRSEKLMVNSVARSICASISNELISIVPLLDDYLCPVCFAIAYQPIRLDCGHIFCPRCLVKLQRRRERFCPLCRGDVVMKASSQNIDVKLQRFLKKHFAAEAKEKLRSSELERAQELYGKGYKPPPCIVM